VVLTVLVHLPGFGREVVNADEASIGIQAEVLTHGGRLYHDVIDRKPPVVPYLYAATFWITGSHDLRTARALGVAALAATALLVGRMARRRAGPRAGTVAALLFTLGAVAFAPEDAQAANFEVFAVLPMTLAVAAAERGRAGRAGLALVTAALCKQTAAATLLPVATLLRAPGARLRAAAIAVGVFGATAVACGGRPFLTWVLTGNGDYLGADRGSWSLIGLRLVEVLALFALSHAAAVLLALRAATGRSQWAADADRHLWLWLLSALVGAVAGFRFYGHYFLLVLPPLAVLGGIGAASTSRRLVTGLVGTAAATAAVWVAVAVRPGLVEDRPRWEGVAAAVEAATAPGDRILVWGHLPEVAWAADRAPAGGFVHTDFLTGRSGGRALPADPAGFADPELWTAFLADLEADPPALVVDTASAAIRHQEAFPIAAFPRLRAWFDAGWCRLAVVDGVGLYRPCSTGPREAP
jgi:hypothetical protein